MKVKVYTATLQPMISYSSETENVREVGQETSCISPLLSSKHPQSVLPRWK